MFEDFTTTDKSLMQRRLQNCSGAVLSSDSLRFMGRGTDAREIEIRLVKIQGVILTVAVLQAKGRILRVDRSLRARPGSRSVAGLSRSRGARLAFRTRRRSLRTSLGNRPPTRVVASELGTQLWTKRRIVHFRRRIGSLKYPRIMPLARSAQIPVAMCVEGVRPNAEPQPRSHPHIRRPVVALHKAA